MNHATPIDLVTRQEPRPKNPVVFYRIFNNEQDLIINFLNAMLPFNDDRLITDIEYLVRTEAPKIPEFDNPYFYLQCITNNNSIFTVALQVNWTCGFAYRMSFSDRTVSIEKKKKHESYNLTMRHFAISIVDEVFDKNSASYYHHYPIVMDNESDNEVGGLQFVLIELRKFKESYFPGNIMHEMWLRFLIGVDRNKPFEADLTNYALIARAIKKTEIDLYSDRELAHYEKYFDGVSCERTLMSAGYTQGYRMGLEKASKENFKKGLKKGFEKGFIESIEGVILKLIEHGMPEEEARRIMKFDMDEVWEYHLKR